MFTRCSSIQYIELNFWSIDPHNAFTHVCAWMYFSFKKSLQNFMLQRYWTEFDEYFTAVVYTLSNNKSLEQFYYYLSNGNDRISIYLYYDSKTLYVFELDCTYILNKLKKTSPFKLGKTCFITKYPLST